VKPVAVLVVAKAPVPGLAKTRLAAGVGAETAAAIAAAALLDTLDAVADAAVTARVVALTGDLGRACCGSEIRDRLDDFVVVLQRGGDFAKRLANAHADAAAATGLPVVQIGMDTPQVTAALLDACGNALSDADAVLGMARDGGWWVLGVRDSSTAACLADVEMSTSATGVETLAALRATGATVTLVAELADIDTVDDIGEVRRACLPDSRFVRATRGF
jgi:rSAM/selenodomain-associated transferase 1